VQWSCERGRGETERCENKDNSVHYSTSIIMDCPFYRMAALNTTLEPRPVVS
jgi:hypothetical protein